MNFIDRKKQPWKSGRSSRFPRINFAFVAAVNQKDASKLNGKKVYEANGD